MYSAAMRRGFTLIDLIVTTGLVGLVTAMGAPGLTDALRRRTTQTAADQFAAAHALARATAVRYGRVAQLHIDAAARRFWVEADTSGDALGQRATVWYDRTLTDPGLQMSSDRAVICFDARGLARSIDPCEAGDVTVVFTALEYADTIHTTVLGKILR